MLNIGNRFLFTISIILHDSSLTFPVVFVVDKQSEEESSSQVPISSQNGSPRPNRVEILNKQFPEAYDVVLQRKENEGFGFVILTSKNKPPPGGKY